MTLTFEESRLKLLQFGKFFKMLNLLPYHSKKRNMKNLLSLQNKKHTIIIIAVCFFLPQNTFAQSKTDADHENFFRFGAKAGVNINKISVKAYN